MLARRSHYRCTDHLHAGFTPAALEVVARGDGYVVVDAGFTVARSGGLCACGLPADHRYPADGEPRACVDETVRIARVRPSTPPPATFLTEPVPPLSVTGDETCWCGHVLVDHSDTACHVGSCQCGGFDDEGLRP